MKFKHLALALAVGMFSPILNSNAAEVTGLSVNADYETLNILWNPLSSTDFGSADGYALQFSEKQNDVQITKSVTSYQSADDISLRRNSFDNDTFYYARVYTYKVDDNNDRVLGNGSDMLKFKVDFNNTVTTENISITDPVISSTGTEQDMDDFEFGTLRKYAYDTFADFFWSLPREMASGDYDGFVLKVSENNDMEDPLVEATVDGETSSIRVTGLTASKTYYAQGFFYKEQGGGIQTFGDSPIRSFETIIAIPRDSASRESRNIIKVENRAIRKIAVGTSSATSSSTSTSNSTSTSTSTSSSSSSSSSNVSSSSSASINSASQTEIRNKIADLKRQISALNSELRRWEARDTSTSSSSTSTSSSSSSSSSTSGLSIRERLKLILEAKRNNQ